MWTIEQLKQWLGESWYEHLKHEFKMSHMQTLQDFIDNERRNSKTVLPTEENVFRFFRECPYTDVKAVILGMNPSVASAEESSSYYQSYVRELVNDIYDGLNPSQINPISSLPKQGVLILDTVLTYDLTDPDRYVGKGWEKFAKFVVQRLNSKPSKILFVLIGEEGKEYEQYINESYHKVINIPHPKDKSFEGSKMFSKTNSFLKSNYNVEIEW